jgi:hypothetical protein
MVIPAIGPTASPPALEPEGAEGLTRKIQSVIKVIGNGDLMEKRGQTDRFCFFYYCSVAVGSARLVRVT